MSICWYPSEMENWYPIDGPIRSARSATILHVDTRNVEVERDSLKSSTVGVKFMPAQLCNSVLKIQYDLANIDISIWHSICHKQSDG